MNNKIMTQLLHGLYQLVSSQSLCATAGKTIRAQRKLLEAYADGLGKADESEHAEKTREMVRYMRAMESTLLLHANGGDTLMQGLTLLTGLAASIKPREGDEPVDVEMADFEARIESTRRLLRVICDTQGEEVAASLILRYTEEDDDLPDLPEGHVGNRILVIGGDKLSDLEKIITGLREAREASGQDEGDFIVALDDDETPDSVH